MADTLARSQITAGDFTLVIPIRPYTAQWGYQQNINSTDTIGGRVVQLLSVQVTDLQVESVAVSRRELQRIATGVKRIMAYHIDTSLPAYYIVPSRNWKFRVFIRAMPQIGWQVETVSYPYSLTMAIQEDITGVKSKHILTTELTRLAEGIGYNPAVHGGDYKGFQKLVDSLLTARGAGAGNTGTSNLQGTFGPGSTTKVDVSGLNGSQTTVEQWAAAVLKAGGWPVCQNNLIYFVAWGIKENGLGRYNVLGTTVGGSVTHDFATPEEGIATVVSFLNNGNYNKVVSDLAKCENYQITGQDITASPWCFQCGSYIMPILAEVSKSYSSYKNQTLNAFK